MSARLDEIEALLEKLWGHLALAQEELAAAEARGYNRGYTEGRRTGNAEGMQEGYEEGKLFPDTPLTHRHSGMEGKDL